MVQRCSPSFALLAVAALSTALALAGCGRRGQVSPPLTVHPVKGMLLTKAGQPVAGGAIEFVKMGDPPRNARSEVRADGTFTLLSMTADGKKYEGAEEGEYRVIFLPATNDQTVPPVELPAKVKIQTGPNDLKLTLPK
jgi:hypothetical protein